MVSSLYVSLKPFALVLPVFPRPFQVRAQSFSFRDEGRFSKMVDANLGVLRERMEEVKMKEKVERCYLSSNYKPKYGWNYAQSYDYKLKMDKQFSQFLQFLLAITASLGFTFLTEFCSEQQMNGRGIPPCAEAR